MQLEILGDFKGAVTGLQEGFAELARGRKSLQRYRLGNYRIYFEPHKLGVVVHRILSRNTVKDFFFRNVNMTQNEDDALAENPDFWEMIDEAASVSREEA